jgi:PAS domain S-box-containing protein
MREGGRPMAAVRASGLPSPGARREIPGEHRSQDQEQVERRRMTSTDSSELKSLTLQGMRSILDYLPEGVIIAAADGHIVEFNSAAKEILGVPLYDIPPADWAAAYGCYQVDTDTPLPPEAFPLVRAIHGEATDEELIYIRNPIRPAGMWILAAGKPLRGPSGEIVGGIILFRDATEQMRAAEQMQLENLGSAGNEGPGSRQSLDALTAYFEKYRQSYARFASVVMGTADGIVITDPSGTIEFVNPGFETTTGYSWEEAIGRNPRILQSGHHDREFYEHMWGQITRGRHFRGTILNRRKDGKLFWSEQTISPVRDAEGDIVQYVSVLKDITELRAKHAQDIQLQIANRVQQGLYPPPVSVPGFDIHGAVTPADEAGGDYYDIIVADDYVWIVIGDVSGHGLGAALIMASTRAFVRSFLKASTNLGEVMFNVNRELLAEVHDDFFVALCLVRLRMSDRSMVYANAGHFPGYVINADGKVAFELRNTGMPLGIEAEVEIGCSEELDLAPGSLGVFFTDGILEAVDSDEREFGIERALELVRVRRAESAQRIAVQVLDSVKSFVGNQPQSDDLTCLIFKTDDGE